MAISLGILTQHFQTNPLVWFECTGTKFQSQRQKSLTIWRPGWAFQRCKGQRHLRTHCATVPWSIYGLHRQPPRPATALPDLYKGGDNHHTVLGSLKYLEFGLFLCIFLFFLLCEMRFFLVFLARQKFFFRGSGWFEFASGTEIRSASVPRPVSMGCLGPCKLLGQGRRLFGCPLAVIWMLDMLGVLGVFRFRPGRPRLSFTMVRQCKGGKSFTPISSNFCFFGVLDSMDSNWFPGCCCEHW